MRSLRKTKWATLVVALVLGLIGMSATIRAVAAGDVERPRFLSPVALPDPPPPRPASACAPLTLEQLEQTALANNPTIPAALGLVQQQQGLLRQSTLYPNPTAGYVRTDADQPGQTRTQGVFLSQEFVTGGKIGLAREAGEREVQHSDWQLQAQRQRVLNDVRMRFFEALGAEAAIAVSTELENLAADGVKAARKLLEAKQGSRPDLLQAEMQLSAVRAALQDARLRHDLARRQLAHVAGLSELPTAPLAGAIAEETPQLDWDKARDSIIGNSPLLRAQQSLIDAAVYDLKLARAQAIPNVNVQVVAQRDAVQKYSSVSTLVSIPVPVFNRNQGHVLNMQGQLLQQQKEYERVRLALLDQLAQTFRQYLTLQSQAARLKLEILPLAKENLDLTTNAFKVGHFEFPRLLAARQTYFQNSLAYIETQTELHKVTVEIDGLLLTGGLNPTEVGTALQGQASSGTTGQRGVLLQQLQEQRNTASRNLPGAIQAGER